MILLRVLKRDFLIHFYPASNLIARPDFQPTNRNRGSSQSDIGPKLRLLRYRRSSSLFFHSTGMSAFEPGRRAVCFRMFATANKARRKVDRAESKVTGKASREISQRRAEQSKGDLDLQYSLFSSFFWFRSLVLFFFSVVPKRGFYVP